MCLTYTFTCISKCTQLCLTFCSPRDCRPPGPSVHSIFQAKILKWVAISFSRGSSQSRGRNHISYVSAFTGRFFTTSLVAERVKHLPTMQETQVQILGQEDLLEKELITHSSILAWKIPWMEKPGRLQSMGSQRVGHNWATSLLLSLPLVPSEKAQIHCIYRFLFSLYSAVSSC